LPIANVYHRLDAESLEYVEEEGRGPTCITPTSFDLYAIISATTMDDFDNAIIEKIYGCKDTVISTSLDRQELSNG
jgi:hypothetical protein